MGYCKKCCWYKPEQMGGAFGVRGYCFLNPPAVMPLPQQIPVQREKSRVAIPQEPQVGIFPTSVRPYVNEMDGCSHWKLEQIQ